MYLCLSEYRSLWIKQNLQIIRICNRNKFTTQCLTMYKFFMLISTTFYGELSQNAGDNCSKPDNTYYIYYYVFKPKQTFRKLKKELIVIIIVSHISDQ